MANVKPGAPKRRMAEILIDIKAVGATPDTPFTLTSGVKSPVYIDVRRLISFVKEREEAVQMLVDLVTSTAGGEVDAIAGGETAGIPYAAFLSTSMGLPMLYVRKKPKGFGKNALVEGYLEEGKRVVLVEDLIFDGGSKVSFVEGLRTAGFLVQNVYTIASYGLNDEYEKSLGAIGVGVHWLTDWQTIIDVGEESGFFTKETACTVRDFLRDPRAWSQERGGK